MGDVDWPMETTPNKEARIIQDFGPMVSSISLSFRQESKIFLPLRLLDLEGG